MMRNSSFTFENSKQAHLTFLLKQIMKSGHFRFLCCYRSAPHDIQKWTEGKRNVNINFYYFFKRSLKFSPESSNGTQYLQIFGVFRINIKSDALFSALSADLSIGRHLNWQHQSKRDERRQSKWKNVNWSPFKKYHFKVMAWLSSKSKKEHSDNSKHTSNIFMKM
jgi:hypothetical protein